MKRKRVVLAVAGALLVGGGVAAAQVYVPGGGGLLWRAQQREEAFARTLALDAEQSRAWQELSRERGAFLTSLHGDLATLATAVKADLARPDPDLHATLAGIQGTVDREIAAHRALRQSELAFYDRLDPRQQAKVREHLLERIQRLERIRETVLDLATAVQG